MFSLVEQQQKIHQISNTIDFCHTIEIFSIKICALLHLLRKIEDDGNDKNVRKKCTIYRNNSINSISYVLDYRRYSDSVNAIIGVVASSECICLYAAGKGNTFVLVAMISSISIRLILYRCISLTVPHSPYRSEYIQWLMMLASKKDTFTVIAVIVIAIIVIGLIALLMSTWRQTTIHCTVCM